VHHGRSGLASFDDAAVANDEVQALAQRVDLQEDKSHTVRYPDETPCDVRIVMKDGTTHSGHCTVMKGEPANPHRPQDLEGKFFDLGTPVWGAEVTRKLYEGMMDIEAIPDFAAFSAELTL
jgi:2-methylcitrate dehydratase PrpD